MQVAKMFIFFLPLNTNININGSLIGHLVQVYLPLKKLRVPLQSESEKDEGIGYLMERV